MTVIRINIPVDGPPSPLHTPPAPGNGQSGVAPNANVAQVAQINIVPQVNVPGNPAGQPSPTPQVTSMSLSQNAAKKLVDRTVTKENIADVLREDGVPDDLIKMIHQDFLSSKPRQDNAQPESGQAVRLSKMRNSVAFTCNLLNKEYMRFMRFREGDLPFPEETCETLAKLNDQLKEYRTTLSKTISELVDERSSSCVSDCLPTSDCCSKNTQRALKYTLFLTALIGYFILTSQSQGASKASQGDMVLYYLTLIGLPLAFGLPKIYSLYRQDQTQDHQKAAEQQTHLARKALDKISLEMRDILTKQGKLFDQCALEMMQDYIDATPFLATETEQGRSGALTQTYSALSVGERRRMEIQATLITHYAQNHFDSAFARRRKAMERFIDPSTTPDLTADTLLNKLSLAKPIVTPRHLQKSSDVFNVYKQYAQQQADFVRLASRANAAKPAQRLPPVALHMHAVQMFPLSCGSLADYLVKESSQMTSAPDASGRERKSSVGSDDRASNSSDSDKSTDVKAGPVPEVTLTIPDDGKRRGSRRPSQPANEAPASKSPVNPSPRGKKLPAMGQGPRQSKGRGRGR
ncbi:MAG: hypothetical protein ACHQT8_00930 [Chlamydiales bacterium]